MDGLEALELSQRARQWIGTGRTIATELFRSHAPVARLVRARVTRTEGNRIAVLYLPHSHLIMERGLADFENGMRANYELTKRFSAEFSIRPFLTKYRINP